MMKERPCKVTRCFTMIHGKIAVGGVDLFTGKKQEAVFLPFNLVKMPIVKRIEMEVADIEGDGFVSAIMEDGSLFLTLKLPIEDKKIYNELMGLWEERGEKSVLFTLLKCMG